MNCWLTRFWSKFNTAAVDKAQCDKPGATDGPPGTAGTAVEDAPSVGEGSTLRTDGDHETLNPNEAVPATRSSSCSEASVSLYKEREG